LEIFFLFFKREEGGDMIKVLFFGELVKKIEGDQSISIGPLIVEYNSENLNSITDILNESNIKPEEISHIFVNGIYSGLNKKVTDGDRVGIFPKRMCLLYKWYFTKVDND
jgi:molybdopterin converting factor small subunit